MMKTKIWNYLIFLAASSCLLGACQGGSENGYTSGKVKIIADESFAPIVDAELYVFQNTYPNAKVEMEYQPENQLLNSLLNGKTGIAILSRQLRPSESAVFQNKQIKVRVNRFAIDGIALIAHNSVADSLLSVDDLIAAMKGNPGKIKTLVFDNPNSSTVRYMMELAGIKLLPKKGVYALKSNTDVIKYVHNNPGAIGVIGVNWIQDPGSDLEKYVEDLRVLGIKNLAGKTGSDNYYKPSQDNLATGVYPLTRNLYIINCQGGGGVGAGFASFLAGETGQRIVLKSGLLPDSIPPREVIIRK